MIGAHYYVLLLVFTSNKCHFHLSTDFWIFIYKFLEIYQQNLPALSASISSVHIEMDATIYNSDKFAFVCRWCQHFVQVRLELIGYSHNRENAWIPQTSTLQAGMHAKLKSPHLKVPSGGDFNFIGTPAWNVEVPPLQAQDWEGSSWPDPAVCTLTRCIYL